jgi:hypothetical protein
MAVPHAPEPQTTTLESSDIIEFLPIDLSQWQLAKHPHQKSSHGYLDLQNAFQKREPSILP